MRSNVDDNNNRNLFLTAKLLKQGYKLFTSCFTAVKNVLSRTVERYIRDPVKIYFGLLKIQVIL